jgi:hypothetical protein
MWPARQLPTGSQIFGFPDAIGILSPAVSIAHRAPAPVDVERVPRASAEVGFGLHQTGFGCDPLHLRIHVLEKITRVERDTEPGRVDRIDDSHHALGRAAQAPVVLEPKHDAALLGPWQASLERLGHPAERRVVISMAGKSRLNPLVGHERVGRASAASPR